PQVRRAAARGRAAAARGLHRRDGQPANSRGPAGPAARGGADRGPAGGAALPARGRADPAALGRIRAAAHRHGRANTPPLTSSVQAGRVQYSCWVAREAGSSEPVPQTAQLAGVTTQPGLSRVSRLRGRLAGRAGAEALTSTRPW